MQVTITEVYVDEGVWVESDTATYLISYDDEVIKLARACGIDVDAFTEELLSMLEEEHVGRKVEIDPGFITL